MENIGFCQKPQDAGMLSNQGFTLVETLFALSVFSVIVFFLSPLFQIMLRDDDLNANLQQMEWDVFCSEIKFELHSSTSIISTGDHLVFTTSLGTVTFEKYNDSLRRQVNGTGHEILLQNVDKVSFSKIKNAILVSVTDTTGKDYSVTVYSFLDWSDAT